MDTLNHVNKRWLNKLRNSLSSNDDMNQVGCCDVRGIMLSRRTNKCYRMVGINAIELINIILRSAYIATTVTIMQRQDEKCWLALHGNQR